MQIFQVEWTTFAHINHWSLKPPLGGRNHNNRRENGYECVKGVTNVIDDGNYWVDSYEICLWTRCILEMLTSNDETSYIVIVLVASMSQWLTNWNIKLPIIYVKFLQF